MEENAGSDSGDFWKCVRAIGLKGKQRVNLEEVYDQQGEIKTGNDVVEVWRSYFETLLGGESELSEFDTGGKFVDVLQPMMHSGDGLQLDLSGQLDILLLQEEVDCAFSRVRKKEHLGRMVSPYK